MLADDCPGEAVRGYNPFMELSAHTTSFMERPQHKQKPKDAHPTYVYPDARSDSFMERPRSYSFLERNQLPPGAIGALARNGAPRIANKNL